MILDRLAAGEPLRAICRDEGMPDERRVRAWAADANHPFAARYTHAREMGFFSMADELLEIADDSRNDWINKIAKSGEVDQSARRGSDRAVADADRDAPVAAQQGAAPRLRR